MSGDHTELKQWLRHAGFGRPACNESLALAAIEALEGEVAELEERLQAASIHAGEVEARAELLRTVIDRLDVLISKDNDEAKALIRETLKESK